MADDAAHDAYERGRQAMARGAFDDAVTELSRSASELPHFKTLELLGECLLTLGRAKEAIVPLAAATALNRQARAPSLLAKALLAIGDREAAREAANGALSRDPENRLALQILESVGRGT